MSPFTKGILLYIGTWSIIPLMDAAAKSLGVTGYSIVEITWARFFFNAVLILPFLAVSKTYTFRRPKKLHWLAFGVSMQLVATYCYFTALKTLPIAEALAIYFIYPFLITAFAPLVLGEQVGFRRWSAVIVGFIGTLIILRPGIESLPPGAYYVLGGAVCFAFYNLFVRKLTAVSGAGEILGYQSLIGAAAMSILVPFFWKTPDLFGLALFLAMGVVSVSAHFMLIKSYQLAPASFLAPFAYFEIISATLVGLFLFSEFPGPWTWAGIAVIVSCGVYISIRERVK